MSEYCPISICIALTQLLDTTVGEGSGSYCPRVVWEPNQRHQTPDKMPYLAGIERATILFDQSPLNVGKGEVFAQISANFLPKSKP
jgi:hypothetical protein